jgi:CarD family transcriptional regulator
MYQIGQLVIYGGNGVCRVTGYEAPPYPHADKTQKYYRLEPLYQDGVIYTPVNTRVFIRPVISRIEAEKLIDMIPTIHAKAHFDGSVTQLSTYYESFFKSHNCEDLVHLVMSIYAKKQYVESTRKKFGQMDEKFMKRAEFLLNSELAVALNIPKDDVYDYISSRVGKPDEAAVSAE